MNSKNYFYVEFLNLLKEQTKIITGDKNIDVTLDFNLGQLYIDFMVPNQKIESYIKKDKMILLIKALDLCVYPYFRLKEQVPFVEMINLNHRRLIFNLTTEEIAI